MKTHIFMWIFINPFELLYWGICSAMVAVAPTSTLSPERCWFPCKEHKRTITHSLKSQIYYRINMETKIGEKGRKTFCSTKLVRCKHKWRWWYRRISSKEYTDDLYRAADASQLWNTNQRTVRSVCRGGTELTLIINDEMYCELMAGRALFPESPIMFLTIEPRIFLVLGIRSMSFNMNLVGLISLILFTTYLFKTNNYNNQ